MNEIMEGLWKLATKQRSGGEIEQQDIVAMVEAINTSSEDILAPLISPIGVAFTIGNKDIYQAILDRYTPENIIDQAVLATALYCGMENIEEVVSLLIEKGADVNAKNSLGVSVLHHAVRESNAGVVRLLIEAGADVHAKDIADASVLLDAASVKKDDTDIVRLLIEAGADVHARSCIGMNAAYAAAASGNKGVLSLLIEKGADWKKTNEQDQSVLHVAAARGQLDVLDDLINSEEERRKKSAGKQSIHQAHSTSKAPLIVNMQDKNGDTPLHSVLEALSSPRGGGPTLNTLMSIGAKLIEAGADISIPNKNGESPSTIDPKMVKDMSSRLNVPSSSSGHPTP